MSAVKVIHSCPLSAIFLNVSRSLCDVREMLRFCSILRSLLRVIGSVVTGLPLARLALSWKLNAIVLLAGIDGSRLKHDRTASTLLATLSKKLGFLHIFCRGTYLKFLLGIKFPEPCAAAFDGKSPAFLPLFWSVPMCRNCITELTSLRCYIA